MATDLLRHELADLLEERGWRWRRGSGVRGWQDPLKPDGELLGLIAALGVELRREERPGEEFDRAAKRERPFDEGEDDSQRLSGFRGYMECWRVLRPGGTLVFKWADKLERVRPHFPATPIVGTRSPRGGQTRWFIFYKPLVAAELEAVA